MWELLLFVRCLLKLLVWSFVESMPTILLLQAAALEAIASVQTNPGNNVCEQHLEPEASLLVHNGSRQWLHVSNLARARATLSAS
jgi:hypothetical protein